MYEFYWKVAEGGYDWIKGKQFDDNRCLVDAEFLCERVDGVQPMKNYPPLKESGLFKIFAETEPTRDGIVAFANRYGMLGGEASEPRLLPQTKGTYYQVRAETLETWGREITTMRHAVALWSATEDRDIEFLSPFIKWHGTSDGWQRDGVSYVGPQTQFDAKPQRFFLASPTRDPETMARFQQNDPVLPARYGLHYLINEKLKTYTSSPRLLWDRTHKKPEETVRVVPHSLIAAMWVQFANAIEGNHKLLQCSECRKWFRLSGDRRADSRFCSNACRFRAYRERQKQARKLYESGTPLREIAKQLGSETKTVKGWIK